MHALSRWLLAPAALLVAAALSFAPAGPAAASSHLVIFAAASMKNALDEIALGYASSAAKPAPRLSYAGSSALARQIEQGAPADIFISADTDWMDYLELRKRVRGDARVDVAGNSLVVIAPAGARVELADLRAQALTRALGDGRLAVAEVNSVPAGKYAKAALEKLGVWEAVKGQLAQTENVRAALMFVARGEAPLGVVYRTDAFAEPRVAIAASIPPGAHPRITYPAAVVTASKNPDAAGFLDYLVSPQARAAFEKHGFVAAGASAGK